MDVQLVDLERASTKQVRISKEQELSQVIQKAIRGDTGRTTHS